MGESERETESLSLSTLPFDHRENLSRSDSLARRSVEQGSPVAAAGISPGDWLMHLRGLPTLYRRSFGRMP